MMDKALGLIVKKFCNQVLVFANFFLNRILRDHPELADSDEIREIRASICKLREEEEHL
jgi:hypothetical protein